MAVLLGLGMDRKILIRRQFCHVTILQDYHEIMFEVNWTASVPRDVVMNTMRLITDKVIPQFK
jgi:hypothetical protein